MKHPVSLYTACRCRVCPRFPAQEPLSWGTRGGRNQALACILVRFRARDSIEHRVLIVEFADGEPFEPICGSG